MMFYKRTLIFLILVLYSAFSKAESFSSNGVDVYYYQGGEYIEYFEYLEALVLGLKKEGVISIPSLPESKDKDSKKLWSWLSDNVASEHLNFHKDNYFTAGWEESSRQKVKGELLSKVKSKPKSSMILAMGTWAGLDVTSEPHTTPVMVISSTDPIAAGIVKKGGGFSNVYAHYDPEFHDRQIKLFYDIVGFSSLGVAYENSVEGNSYTGIDKIRSFSKKSGVDVISCYTESDTSDQNKADSSVLGCLDFLVDKVDAIYLADQGGVNLNTVPKIVKIANKYGKPVFSGMNSDFVRYGLLLSLSKLGKSDAGDFLADKLLKILKGAPPGDLTMVYRESQKIAINLKTAEEIGLYLYADTLAAADKIYYEIEAP